MSSLPLARSSETRAASPRLSGLDLLQNPPEKLHLRNKIWTLRRTPATANWLHGEKGAAGRGGASKASTWG